MKKKKTNQILAAAAVAALFALLIAIHGCGSDAYDTSGLTAPSALQCGSATGAPDSLVINNGATSTQSRSVKLTFHAEDPDNITAYYVSESATTPAPSAAGWVPVTGSPCAALDGTDIAFDVTPAPSVGLHPRTVYIWFQDSAGNVSAPASDSINLILAAAGC